jgi:TrpR-related protein YerC/YecD
MKKTKASTKDVNELYKAILGLKTIGECQKFFRDLCTINELSSMAERLQVVKMIQNNISYREISEKTGASTATITRVAHWYHHGNQGYNLVLKRLHRH